MKKQIAIGYVRVSTIVQAEEGISLEAQRKKIEAYCDLNDLELGEIIEDAGLSGKSIAGRPGIQKVLDLVKSGKIGHVVIYKLDRLARNVKEANEIADILKKKSVRLHSISEKIDSGTATGKLFFNILASMAEWEREIISERTKLALSTKREKGERISRHAPYGFRFINGRVVENPKEQVVIREVRKLRLEGHSIRQIASLIESAGHRNRKLKAFGKSEIAAIVKNAA